MIFQVVELTVWIREAVAVLTRVTIISDISQALQLNGHVAVRNDNLKHQLRRRPSIPSLNNHFVITSHHVESKISSICSETDESCGNGPIAASQSLQDENISKSAWRSHCNGVTIKREALKTLGSSALRMTLLS
jgi:hypothetical protein